ncbi:hypothetical protein, partial [Desulfovibrio sp.]|uniref:hypothetical protein n=1 Tax=Desulfovibrio sp. TaxID=885 RepID=UPI003FEF6FDB
SATLPRLKSRVQIPSPAPGNSGVFSLEKAPFFVPGHIPRQHFPVARLSEGFPVLLPDRKKTCHTGEFAPFFAILGHLT